MKIHPFASISALFVGSDEQSMQRVRADDDLVAFAQRVRRWQGPVLGLCARMTGDSHLAEDLTQEVFARVLAKRKDYQSSAKFSTWLWRIALNRCYDELRRTRQRGECAMERTRGLRRPRVRRWSRTVQRQSRNVRPWCSLHCSDYRKPTAASLYCDIAKI